MHDEPEDGLSVVIPVYNSEGIVSVLYERLTNELGSLGEEYEIILVNDCSRDNSWQKLQEMANSDPHVKAISLRRNAGYDNAIMAGLRFVRFAYVVIMDDDLQHAPEDIKSLLGEIRKGFDVVYANFHRKEQSLIKNVGSWLNDKLARLIINMPAGLHVSSFKILRREIVSEIVKYDGPFPYVDGLIFQVTSSFHRIVIKHHKRFAGRGGHGVRQCFKIVFNFCTTFSILPLRIATLSGFLISFLAGIFCIVLVVWKVWFGIDVEGWGSIMLGIAMMGGIQLTAIGIIGEYIGRTYMNINRRPQYVIRQVVDGNRGTAFELNDRIGRNGKTLVS